MTRCESSPPCFGTIYFPTAPFLKICAVKNQRRNMKNSFYAVVYL